MRRLFGLVAGDFEIDGVIRGYFDCIYDDGIFLDALDNFSRGESYVRDGVYCVFPEVSDPDYGFFKGVRFEVGYPSAGGRAIAVSVEDFVSYLELACARYISLHPMDCEQVSRLLSVARGSGLPRVFGVSIDSGAEG